MMKFNGITHSSTAEQEDLQEERGSCQTLCLFIVTIVTED